MKFIQENLENKKIIAIDFDGTLTSTNKFPNIGPIREGASYYTNLWHEHGFFIIIWTCRYLPEHVDDMVTFLRENNVYFDTVNSNYPDLDFQPYPKIFANYYLDDRSIPKFHGFAEADKIIRGLV